MSDRRAGRYVKQLEGYRAFIPAALPLDPPLAFDQATSSLLSQADQRLGRLDGLTRTLPNPDLFVAMYVRREAVLSSQIEGTQSSLDDLLEFELEPSSTALPADVEEVVNYVRAMNYGLERLSTLPLSLRLLREIHAELMQGVRGGDRFPGEFRKTQNWIGRPGASLSEASFVPPPPHELHGALTSLEQFLHSDEQPALVHAALVHAQFETIHPFIDGNGRVGRLLISFLLCHRGVLHRPLLYLSHYFKQHRADYYAALQSVREDGGWERWVTFFLAGAAETAQEAAVTACAIMDLRQHHRKLADERGFGVNGLKLLDLLFVRPLVNVNLVRDQLGLSDNTARRLLQKLTDEGLLNEVTGAARGRIYRYTSYLDLFTTDDD